MRQDTKIEPVVRARSEEERRRILDIAVQIVASQVEKGELNPENDNDLREATRRAVSDATEAYRAAVDFVSG